MDRNTVSRSLASSSQPRGESRPIFPVPPRGRGRGSWRRRGQGRPHRPRLQTFVRVPESRACAGARLVSDRCERLKARA